MLATYKAETRVIPLGDSSVSVAGLSLDAFTQLIQTHFDDLDAIFNLISGVTKDNLSIGEDDVQNIIVKVISEAPGLVANVICVAAGETGDDAHKAALTIPFPKQLEIVTVIADLTFKEVGGIKKSLDLVQALMNKVKLKV